MPVAVALIPGGRQYVAIRRGIPPQIGKIAFPGGYICSGETFHEALSREVLEETGIEISSEAWEIFHVGDSLQSDRILLFAVRASISPNKVNLSFQSPETQQVLLINPNDETVPFAFDLHKAAAEVLSKRRFAQNQTSFSSK